MAGEDDNLSNNFRLYKDEKLVLKGANIKENDIDLVSESLDTGTHIRNILSGYTFQNKLLRNKWLSFLRKVKFSD